MKNYKAENGRIQLFLKAVVVFALTAATFLMLYKQDNKYTAQGPKARDGTLTLDCKSLEEHPVLFLVDGWEYYSGRLLTPEDFGDRSLIPDQHIFIGQFGGFEKWNGGAPHGSASYRLNIFIPEVPDTYLLELPEIFSSYHLYVNGRHTAQMGEPSFQHYRPETSNRSVSIEAGGRIELLFAVSDYSHLYSGIVYPPAFGQPNAVSQLLNARLIFRSLLCAAALTVGLLSIMVGLLARRNIFALAFGLLCLFFVGYAGYPLIRTLFTGFRAQYVIENVSFCAMLCVTMVLAMKMSNFPKKWGIPFLVFGGVMCMASVFLHFLLPLGSLKIMRIYSWLISAYEWITAGLIAVSVLLAIQKGSAHIMPLFYGVVIFVCALIFDRILPMHEPILTGWFIELASFILVLSIGTVTGQDIAARYQESTVITERANSMERLYKSQLSHFQRLKQEMEHTKTLRHDMRHHLTIMNGYMQERKYNKLDEYMKEYRITSAEGELPEYCPIDVINILTCHYHGAAQQNHIHLDIRCDLKTAAVPGYTGMTDSDLCCMYSNLMENAMEACLRIEKGRKTIRVAVFRIAPDILTIRIWNTAENVRQAKGKFLSSKKVRQTGYGLSSIESIAKKYHGKAEFHWKPEKKEFESKVTVMA